jgi:hypothetical protein
MLATRRGTQIVVRGKNRMRMGWRNPRKEKHFMPLRLTAQERSADFIIRKEVSDYRIYPISDAGLRWLKSRSPHTFWSRINGRDVMTASRREVTQILDTLRQNDFLVCGSLCD